MKRSREEEPTRGIEEVKAQLALDSKAEVRESTIKAGARLLSEFVGSMNIKLRPEEMQLYLELLISNTEFADAVIMNRGTAKPNSFQTFPAYDYRMQIIYGEYPHDAYNIWFQRSKDGKWILNFNRVPKNGNWRS